MELQKPVRLLSRFGCVEAAAQEICSFGRRCLIVTGKSGAKASGALDQILHVLDQGGIAFSVYDAIEQNPTVASCLLCADMARASGADFIIGIGGGSSLDAAKVIALAAAAPAFSEDALYAMAWPEKALPLVLVGTTAGTGSEVTNVSVLTDKLGRKHSVHDDRLLAKLSLGDPAFTASLPLPFTLSTGVDAFAHCLESYLSRKATDASRAYSVQGIQTLWEPLLKASRGEVLTLEDREALYNASILGGLAIAITGTVFPHNVGYFLTENYRIPHGIACALFLPDLLAHIQSNCPQEARRLEAELHHTIPELCAFTLKVTPRQSIHMSQSDILQALPRWENNNSVKNTLGTVTASMIRCILEKKFL